MIRNLTYSVLLIFLIAGTVAFFSCTKSEAQPSPEQELFTEDSQLPALESSPAYEVIKRKGILKVATIGGEDMFSTDEGNGIAGFHMDLLEAFAAYLGIEYSVEKVPAAAVFGDGTRIPEEVFTDVSFSYTPPVFDTFDIVIGNLTPLPWRMKLMDFIPVIPNVIMLIGNIETMDRLRDTASSITFPPGSSYEKLFYDLQKEQFHSARPYHVEIGVSPLKVLQAGDAEYAFQDSLALFNSIRDYPEITVFEPVSDLHYLSWAVKKDNDDLYELFRGFLQQVYSDGSLSSICKKYTSLSLTEYYDLIGFTEGQELFNILFTAKERERINRLVLNDGLHIAVLKSPDNYYPLENGTIAGFDYNLALEYANSLGVPLVVHPVEDFSRFFAEVDTFDPAVMEDETIVYTPGLLETVDVYTLPLSITPWRKRLADFIPMVPYGVGIFGRNADQIEQYGDLDGLKVAVLKDSYQENLIASIEKEHDVTMVRAYMNSEENSIDLIYENEADITLDGFINLAKERSAEKEGMSVSPLALRRISAGWAVKNSDSEMESIIGKLVEQSMLNGTFQQIWQDQNGIDFQYYLKLMGE